MRGTVEFEVAKRLIFVWNPAWEIPNTRVLPLVDVDFPLKMQVKTKLDFRVANSVVNLAVLLI